MSAPAYSRRAGRVLGAPVERGDVPVANADFDDSLNAARGIWNGVLIGGVMWALFGLAAWAIYLI